MPERRRRRVVVAGAGLAGLAAARAALDSGAEVHVLEAGAAPGGASVESAGWIWRYRDLPTWRAHAPAGAASIQRLVLERLDADVEWLVDVGVHIRATSTGRDLTRGVRVDPPQLVAALLTSVDPRRIEVGFRLTSLDDVDADAIVLAGGGYAGRLDRIARESGLVGDAAQAWTRRPRTANDGSTMDAACAAGGRRSVADGQCLVRLAAVGVAADAQLAAAVSELHVPGSRLVLDDGRVLPRDPADWSGARQLRRFQLAARPGQLELDAALLDEVVHAGRVGSIVEHARQAGAEVERGAGGGLRIAVQPGITHTWCGVDVDEQSRVQMSGAPHVDVFAAGCDAAGTGLGGTASGLAQALVLGRRAGTIAALGA